MDLMDRRRFLKRIMAQASSVETGSFVVSEDIASSAYHIAHHLGSTPDFVMVVAGEFTASVDMTVRYISNAYCAKTNLIASSVKTDGFASYQTSWSGRDSAWSANEDISYTKFLHDSNFEVPYYSSNDSLKAGVTYHYVIGKFE